MKKYIILFLFSLLLNNIIFSQDHNALFWDSLLNNDRESAGEIFKKFDKGTIQGLITNEILRQENGLFFANKPFIKEFLNQKGFEYYLYGLWNKTYFFDSYLSTGLNEKNIRILEEVSKSKLTNETIKDAILYLNSVTARHTNDWNRYFDLNDSINVIKSWQYCGVFENLNKSGLDRYYPPETMSLSKTDFDAKSNGFVNWYESKNTKEAYQFFTNHEEFGSGVNYAQTFITTKEDKRVILRIGSGSAFKVWLNDVVVFENPEDVTTELDAYKVAVTLPKGTNRLLFKLAESNSSSYFIVKIVDVNGNELNDIAYSSTVKNYNKSNKTQLRPEVLSNEFEAYFLNKIKQEPNNFFYVYCLNGVYLRNSKLKEARDLLKPYLAKYPKSSLIRKLMMLAYSAEGDTASYNELNKNLELDDPDYYLPLVLKVANFRELNRMSISELETFLDRFKKSVTNDLLHLTADFIYNARKEDLANVKKNLDALLDLSQDNLRLLRVYSPLYASLFKDNDKTMALLKDINKRYFDMSAIKQLSKYYEKTDKKDKVIELYTKDLEYLSTDNIYLLNIIKKLHSYKNYKESLKYINMALSNFPYSFQVLELKGDALVQLNKNKEAVVAYEKSLRFNSAKSSLRKKIKDLKNQSNIINSFVLKNVYDYVENHRGKIKINNYGYNILLDDYIIELYSEGGGKYRSTYIYEITSDAGVESFKEYDLGLTGSYFISKSEIVRKDKSIVPAEKSGSKLVFNGLSVGDVVYIDYEGSFSSTGRFYKDYSDKFMFDSFHPTVKTSLKLIVPKGHKIFYKMVNGDLEPKKHQVENYDVYDWTIENLKGLPQTEDYMPNNEYVAQFLHVSTIPNWNEIAVWYSDLVRASIEETSTVQEAFKKVFPNGYAKLSEDQRAKAIYNYIKNNFTYSYVNFKQSGYVPQKPTKTIKTNLGDCKDFSTLFVTLANMAQLNANLVLILTSDYGHNNMVLPSTDFNHCIVKVRLNGKDQFLELTDKYLPYKSLPVSLRGATALEIPFKTNGEVKKYDLFKLDNVLRDKSIFTNKVKVFVKQAKIDMSIETEFKGHINSYYASVLSEPNKEVLEKSIFDDLKGLINEDFVLNKLYDNKRIDDDKIIKYTSDITIDKKTNKIGSINIFKLPKVSNPYTNSIISLDKRYYPIKYINYENVDTYYCYYDVFIDDGKTFVEIPSNSTFSFKNHSYSIGFKLINDNHLKVEMHSVTPPDNIAPTDYPAFKNYVKSIIETQDQFIGFK